MAGFNEKIADELIWVLRKCGFDLDSGDPEMLVRQAEQLRVAADSVRSGYSTANQVLNRLSATWVGRSAAAQDRAWAGHVVLAAQAADAAEGVADTLEFQATNSARIVRAILGVALELLEMFLICLALSWVAGRLADLLFVTRIGAFIARLRSLFSSLSEVVRASAESMRKYGTLAEKIGEYTRILLVEYVPDGIKEFPINLAATVVPAKLGGRDAQVGDVLLALVPGIAQYGALNFAMEILEKENRLVRGLKESVEGRSTASTPVPMPLPDKYRLASPSTGPSFAESLARDPDLPAEVRQALAREFGLDLSAPPAPVPVRTAPAGEEFVVKSNRELVYTFLKETLVNGTSNALTGVQTGNENWLSDAAISAPLSGSRKVALERWLKPIAYHGKPAEATLDERMMSELVMRTLAYSLRNSVREPLQDVANGEPVVTQLTPG